ncbi:hypothetical protein RDI58_002773 [Solanum bulbocastanum]|uniref:NAC domain-containing protein n=1 Tax=Solanum bulbocastanum TaxID=147425 RepID=A0AAN8YRG5_SOLBU
MQLVIDIYADKEPWEILEGTNTNAGYFITLLKKEKSAHHKRFKRIVGEGTWKIQNPIKLNLEKDNIKGQPVLKFRSSLDIGRRGRSNSGTSEHYFILSFSSIF